MAGPVFHGVQCQMEGSRLLEKQHHHRYVSNFNLNIEFFIYLFKLLLTFSLLSSEFFF